MNATRRVYFTMDQIKSANAAAGYFFFEASSMRFFSSRVDDKVYQGSGGIYFVTSEQYDYQSPRNYTVRTFDPATGKIDTVGEFNRMSRSAARTMASNAAAGK